MAGKAPELSMFVFYFLSTCHTLGPTLVLCTVLSGSVRVPYLRDSIVGAGRTFIPCTIICGGLCGLPDVEDHSEAEGWC